MQTLTNPEIRKLKARAQHLEPMFKVGKAGLSEGFVKSVNEGLSIHQLIKVKFVEFKEDKKTLAPELAEKTSSHLIMRVGNVVVLYRPAPSPENVPPAHGEVVSAKP
jgi:RNA-binding protein